MKPFYPKIYKKIGKFCLFLGYANLTFQVTVRLITGMTLLGYQTIDIFLMSFNIFSLLIMPFFINKSIKKIDDSVSFIVSNTTKFRANLLFALFILTQVLSHLIFHAVYLYDFDIHGLATPGTAMLGSFVFIEGFRTCITPSDTTTNTIS